EVDQFGALSSRKGSILLPTLRDAFFALQLGTSNRAASSLHLADDSYRLTLSVNVQPARAGVLLDDSDGGTPQRFMWFPAKDRRITINRPDMPLPLGIPHQSRWEFPHTLDIPKHAEDLIIREHAKRQDDEQNSRDALDGHAVFSREKLAFGLA